MILFHRPRRMPSLRGARKRNRYEGVRLSLDGTWPDTMPADPCAASAGVLGVPTRCSWEHLLRSQASRG